MDKNEVKKVLYKERPIAKRFNYNLTHQGGFYYYSAETSIGTIVFEIPEKDKPESLGEEEQAQLLNRWIKA